MKDCSDVFHRANSSLAILLMATISFKSKDPRDRIFALCGIASDSKKFTVKPDYKDAVGLVFLKTAIFILSTNDWFIGLLRAERGYEGVKSGKNVTFATNPSFMGARLRRRQIIRSSDNTS
jgi:hypothetical protein